ncbi:MAG: hypothetical protein HZB51_34265 [Chloroflexi bacterium]|nr:hypothetical protein [Chloroflexota bacterium]
MTNRMLKPNLRIVIPSRRRIDVLEHGALTLFPHATITVAESELSAYQRAFPSKTIVPHPDSVSGIAPIRQWVLDHFDDEGIFFVDDDVYACISLVNYSPRKITNLGAVEQIILNAATIAKETGTAVFGFSQGMDVRKFRMFEIFGLKGWSGGVIGVIGRDFRYDTSLKLRADIDFCLQVLLERRFTFIENRFGFLHKRFGVVGGNAANRSAQRNQQEIDYLQRKWGGALEVRQAKGTTLLKITVERKQNIQLLEGEDGASDEQGD